MKTKQILVILSLAALSTLGFGCGAARVVQQSSIGPAPATKPTVVYVANFDLTAADIQTEPGVLPPPPKLPSPFGAALPSLPGSPKDPHELARELVETMSESLVRELTKAGFNARRLGDTNMPPTSGWLVRGVFTEVNQGNQLRRAVIGFGTGRTELQVLVDFADLALGTPQALYQLATAADSGQAPGAGPMIVLCPAGAAGRFVLAGQDLKRNVRQTATQIARQLTATGDGAEKVANAR
jgi:hypothetical protein